MVGAVRAPHRQVRIAPALYLFEREAISSGKAAELAGEHRAAFQALAAELGVPAVVYTEEMYEEDLRGLAATAERARQRAGG